VDVSGTLSYLVGDWQLDRLISDHRTGQEGVFRGQARFRLTADDQVLEYREDGELEFGDYRGPASRSLIYRGRSDGAADVRFADGREFYRLDLRSGSCRAEHPCRADQYLVTVTRRSPDSFTETWRVAGPAKDYKMTATFTRSGAK
jgi:Family of unknown function (DUF6314)